RLVTLGGDSRIEIDANRDGVFESAVTLEGVTGGTLVTTDGGLSQVDMRVTDLLHGTGKLLTGTDGNDQLTATSSDGWVLKGGAGDDKLTGAGGNDELQGGSGNDSLDGRGGADTMIGGLGNDDYIVDSVLDVVVEAAGEGSRDRVITSVDYKLSANVEHLQMVGKGNVSATGNELNNIMGGNSGANVLDGGLGADTMDGGTGNDVYYVDNLGDRVIEKAGGGTDLVHSSVSFKLGENVEDLQLTGMSDINGTGNAQANRIFGNMGANLIDGGAGADMLQGGFGNDTFRFAAGEATGDWVLDFQRPWSGMSGYGDKLLFVGYGRDARFSQLGQSDIYVVSSADGSINDEIRILGNTGLTASDVTFGEL
ncbi:calcium-binding protein, partial [Aureimonas ureilytica]|uniref:calcium-binding protein n=1 Tax=Aureimonas ureilytica TaxID=401562 RepID=UPI000AFA1A4E